jgi:hypothetical protein
MKLRLPVAVCLFVLGAVAGLVGDHGHVVTGTTEYLSFAVPFVWSSPFWFPIMVGGATVSLAELRLHLPELRDDLTPRMGLAGVAAVIGIYAVTALVHTAPPVPGIVLIWVLAVITWCALGDRYGAICGALAAAVGPAVEVVIAAAGLFRYADDSDGLFGVAPWLTGLYFAFGVVVALLAELSVARRPAPVR